MAVAAKKLEVFDQGMDKNDLEAALQRISDQIRLIDQSLTVKVDNEVWQSFNNHQQEIMYTKLMIKNMPIITKNDKI
ncbi:hypothetical protein CIL03_03105 [Virgibacillus indicus]|uniref:Uncharacterized protein n=1 Tax=Virgibacillus indicus TaxID=2024554 RepID=A0A265NEC4_9BACI|nr:hypothetical protein [Virgibacillus indicus]OZU90145.1 hypothetical protein CIL03_03105 [Virgibacillus indicus]